MTQNEFHAALADVPSARARFHRFSQALFSFAVQTAGCNRHHSVVERCARSLLLAHDRATGDELPMTQLFISRMLGVRRSSVTVAAELLRTAGAINYVRGRVLVLDRRLLAQRACDCYGIIRSTYDRLLEGKDTRSPLIGRATIAEDLATEEDLTPRAEPESPEASLQTFRSKLLEARKRNDERIVELVAAADERKQELALTEELTLAYEQLDIAEEELRVQMEALNELRISLEATHEQWRARFDGLPEAYIETDQYDSIIEVNRAAEDLVGAQRKALVGKPLASLVQNTDRKSLREVMQRMKDATGTEQWTGTLSGTRRGEPVDVIAAVRATHVGGEPASSSDGANPRGRYIGARWLVRRTGAR